MGIDVTSIKEVNGVGVPNSLYRIIGFKVCGGGGETQCLSELQNSG